jgi:hypothetical protein
MDLNRNGLLMLRGRLTVNDEFGIKRPWPVTNIRNIPAMYSSALDVFIKSGDVSTYRVIFY